jgi:transposase
VGWEIDALGNPVRLVLTAGQVADICQAVGLIEGFSFENLLADKGYDADRFRASIEDAGRSGSHSIEPLPLAAGYPIRQGSL